MGYVIYKIQNTTNIFHPTISISENDIGWDEAYQKWLDGKNPTDSKEWKKGVFAQTRLICNKTEQ